MVIIVLLHHIGNYFMIVNSLRCCIYIVIYWNLELDKSKVV
jgi:hypothetical protein